MSLALLVPALLLAGCDESDPVAPPDSTIILSASPTDLLSGGGTSTLTAVVIDANGVPQDGVAVFFSTNAGALDSQGISQVTDGSGRAFDLLTTSQSAQVRAQSGSATAEVTVTVAGQALVGTIVLNCTPVSGNSGFETSCQAVVRSTTNALMANEVVSVSIAGDAGAIAAPPSPSTDASGTARFSVEQLTIDGAVITASAGSVVSNQVVIDVVSANP